MGHLAKFQQRKLSETRPPPKAYVTLAEVEHHSLQGMTETVALGPYVDRDLFPTPPPEARVHYSANHDDRFWINGLHDYLRTVEAMRLFDAVRSPGPSPVLELGCSGGRVLRHFAADPQFVAYGCELDRSTVQWCRENFGASMRVFQNSVLPHLPLEDNTFDAVMAYSVFSHIDQWEDAWLFEIRRILRPGGIAVVTAQTDRTWARLAENKKRLGKLEETNLDEAGIDAEAFLGPMPRDRVAIRYRPHSPAHAVTMYHSQQYIRREWGTILTLLEIFDAPPGRHQDVVVLKKS